MRAKSKHCSDLGYKILQVRLRREASQGVDNCAYLPENEIKPVSTFSHLIIQLHEL